MLAKINQTGEEASRFRLLGRFIQVCRGTVPVQIHMRKYFNPVVVVGLVLYISALPSITKM